jgi:hypothetical protein
VILNLNQAFEVSDGYFLVLCMHVEEEREESCKQREPNLYTLGMLSGKENSCIGISELVTLSWAWVRYKVKRRNMLSLKCE